MANNKPLNSNRNTNTLLSLLIFFILSINLITIVEARCKSDQVDINEATLKELDKLTGIGPAKGQAIIDSRSYDSLDDLIKVYGIGEATLQKIKDQGLACVSEDMEELEKEQETTPKKTYYEEPTQINRDKTPSETVINLNTETKEEKIIYESKNEKIKKNLLYGFCIFLICLLFLLLRK